MTSPFKFLDSYGPADKPLFFGRDAEIEQLYRLIGETNLVLVYGQSGTGKTSLIQCGLANRFLATDWFQLAVRRGDDINQSLDREIRTKAVTPIDAGAAPVEAIRSLYLDHLRPVYLIFDQFEELSILGTDAEREAFYATIAAIVRSDLSCKIIISLREEYLATLDRFEQVVPALFAKRLRVEPMTMSGIEQVLLGTCAALGITLEHGTDTARRIIAKLADERGGVRLAYLQVYLDRLYHHVGARAGAGDRVVFTDAAIEQTGTIGDLMAAFLDEQSRATQAELDGAHPDQRARKVQLLLEQFVTVDGTKQPRSRAEIAPSADGWIDGALASLQRARILRVDEDRYELAHDSLAGRIADNRSIARKSLLMVQKLVRDRVAAFGQTRTYLNAEEISVVRRARLVGAGDADGTGLDLAEPEAKFVRRSIRKLRFRRFRLVLYGLLTLVVIVVLAALLSFDDGNIIASDEADSTAFSAYIAMSEIPDGRVESGGQPISQIRLNVLAQAAANNAARAGEDAETYGDPSLVAFWNKLHEADALYERGDQADARKAYRALAEEWTGRLREDESDWDYRIRLKAVLWRIATHFGDVEDSRRLLKVLQAEGQDRPTEQFFARDIADQCFLLEAMQTSVPECAGVLSAEDIRAARAP